MMSFHKKRKIQTMAMTTSTLEWFGTLKGKEFHERHFGREFVDGNMFNLERSNSDNSDGSCNYGVCTANKVHAGIDSLGRKAMMIDDDGSDLFIHSNVQSYDRSGGSKEK